MFITLDILQKRGACQEYLNFFAKHHPNGVEMLDVIERGHMPYEALHWGYKWLDPNEEEQKAYWEKVKVINSEGIDDSDNVTNSRLIVESSFVTSSEAIYNCQNITNSKYSVKSSYIDNSEYVFDSNFIDNSYHIYKSNNISNSNEIYDSIYVANSHGIYRSNNIVSSHSIWHSENITDCYFCGYCKDLSHSLFCTNQEGEYLLFNKPIDKNRFEMIQKQYTRFAGRLTLFDTWREDFNIPNLHYSYQKHVANIPDSFWDWIKTLPGYEPSVIYSLTFLPHFLK